MRYAFISDIHANLEALEAVLARIDRLGVDRILCLGDLVGYHTNPNECIDLVRERGIACVAGNHDRAAIGAKDTAHFGLAARRAIDWTRPRLTEANRRFLESLPITLTVEDFLLVHAALHPEPNEDLHLSSPKRVRASLERLASGVHRVEVCFFGHTHRPVVYRLRDGGMCTLHQSRMQLRPPGVYLVNPGSVGQSRDGDARAAFLTFDSAARRIELHRVAYDHAAPVRKAAAAGLVYKESRLRKAANLAADWMVAGRDALLTRLKLRRLRKPATPPALSERAG